MNTTELEIMRTLIKQAVAECDDFELLDLGYKIIVNSKEHSKYSDPA